MAEKFVSERNLRFLLYEVFDVESLTRYPVYEEHNRDIFGIVLETALKMGRDLFRPCFQEMDRNPPEFVDNEVRVHPMVATILRQLGEGGWISANAPYELGGQQLPHLVTAPCRFVFSAANYSASVYAFLSTGAAHLIESFGSQQLIDTYVPKMFEGEWQGTMALTEPQAGSSLTDISTQAIPADPGYYKIRGQKIFISAADHTGVENVVHLMLAKIPGAPPGVKGISLFVVPKKRIEKDGTLVSNDVNVAGIYHKLGYRGSPIVQLSLGEKDDCRGYLVGEAHKGLSYMFQMMNEGRIDVAIGATGIASAAYYASLEYAKTRPQGRRLSAKDPTAPPVPIIEHPDVRRMLLFQRAVVDGSLSLLLQCSKYVDMIKVSEGEEKERYALLLDILTPAAKTYPSEMGVLSVSQGLQCLGGYGYCDEFPLEQHYRDARIHPIHEGTTGIQGLDLLGRKVTMKDGKAFSLYVDEVENAIQSAGAIPGLEWYARRLEEALEKLQSSTSHLLQFAMAGDVERFLADATHYLELFGIVTIAWQWLLQGMAAQNALGGSLSEAETNFYQGKMHTLAYFFRYELPKIEGLTRLVAESDGLTVKVNESHFSD
ncbi:MAG: acyl-CoA dehydrogenase [Deltaproteobacteria bacterium]|nr:acyl-CoA dehydrogenase [Deltaproteobacteria bacterium]